MQKYTFFAKNIGFCAKYLIFAQDLFCTGNKNNRQR